ncbi:four-helix bundle copper-binding protein [Embleya scabrispora]|uniref:four-helix bundle copper-binding protein n=1 Tax=Embleya scabrispora TaxID=159449 RepID=UPI0003686B4F|nr:four-helix bundle copper-binding protein [Embleya scabrispora]MYS84684.1 four-helix bundle copper-binding protein [Streptomyces sp. SID5474]
MNHGGQMTAEMQKCIDACMETHAATERTVSHCLQQGGRHVEMAMIGSLMDASDMTRTCADMMMRQSPMAGEMAAMCAKQCDMTAEACMSMGSDEMMKRCAEACRSCSEACRAMGRMPAR